MKSTSRSRALCALSLAGLALTLLVLLAGSATADGGGNAGYVWKVTKFVYKASGQLNAVKINTAGCTPEDAMWKGSVKTEIANGELSELLHGKGHAEIQEDRTEGVIEAHTDVMSTFSATHYEVTGCDEFGSISNTTTTPCTDEEESKLTLLADIKGGVGTSVKVAWGFEVGEGSLVPDDFQCAKPFKFSNKYSGVSTKCTKSSKSSTLAVLASPTLKLPFRCLFYSLVPPPGTGYTKYGSTVTATGALYLKRVSETR